MISNQLLVLALLAHIFVVITSLDEDGHPEIADAGQPLVDGDRSDGLYIQR